MSSARHCIAAGAVLAALAVGAGAFGAHALRSRLAPEVLAVFQTGVQYHFYHSLGLIVIGVVARQLGDSLLVRWSARLMLAGIILFSGSLYLLALTGVRGAAMAAPLGGTALIAAWALLAIAALRG